MKTEKFASFAQISAAIQDRNKSGKFSDLIKYVDQFVSPKELAKSHGRIN